MITNPRDKKIMLKELLEFCSRMKARADRDLSLTMLERKEIANKVLVALQTNPSSEIVSPSKCKEYNRKRRYYEAFPQEYWLEGEGKKMAKVEMGENEVAGIVLDSAVAVEEYIRGMEIVRVRNYPLIPNMEELRYQMMDE